jgi:DNA replication protein DnaC
MADQNKCEICCGGWVVVEDSRQLNGYAAATCLCDAGIRLQNSSVDWRQKRSSLGSLDQFWSADDIAAAFPDGTAAAADRVRQERLSSIGLPPVMFSWTMDSYRAEVAQDDTTLQRYLTYARTWLDTPRDARTDVILYGTNGTGKTGLAVSMLRASMEQGHRVLFITARDLLERYRNELRNDEDRGISEPEPEQFFMMPDILLIDEWGGTKQTEYARDTLTALIDLRQKSRKTTIITMNVVEPKEERRLLAAQGEEATEDTASVSSQLSRLLGPRLGDRMGESASFWSLMGESRRRRKKRASAS